MTTQEIAIKLVDYCRRGDFEGAHKELYAQDVVSIEPYSTPEFEKETKGLKAVMEKNEKFSKMVEAVHGNNVLDPLVVENSIALILEMDITMKGKSRSKMRELCVYEVKDGKVVSEQFFM